MPDELEEWAKSAPDDDENWRDFHAASFRLLRQSRRDLAGKLAQRFVNEFLREADLSPQRREEALQMLVLEEGTTPTGISLLRVSFPFTGSTTTTEWDGTTGDAEDMINELAHSLADDVKADGEPFGFTEWEREPDL